MIPSAIMNGLWKGKDLELEFRILELSLDGFTFRFSKRHGDVTKDKEGCFELRFFSFEKSEYQKIQITDFEITLEQELPFAYCYRVMIYANDAYERLAGALSREYLAYIRLYMEETPSGLSEKLIGYPAKLDEIYPDTYNKMQEELTEHFFMSIDNETAQGIVVENPWQYEAFLKKHFLEYLRDYCQEAGFREIPPEIADISYIYFGNQVCDHLLPGKEEWIQLLKKCRDEGKTPVLQLPPIREGKIQEIEELLEETERYLRTIQEKLEIVANDWGILRYLAENEIYSVTMGVLLLKQKKDPRLKWKNGFPGNMQSHSAGWKTKSFLEYTKKEYRVSRYSAEAVQYPEPFPDEPVTLYAPWYQMNTSTLCPLYAAVCQGDRGKQKEIRECGYLCKDWQFLYPKHLRMCGRYNTIWGYGTKLLRNDHNKGVDRVVWNF